MPQTTSSALWLASSSNIFYYDMQIYVPFCVILYRIDQKVSANSYGYKQHEAQAILKEVRSIKDAISSGEKEKQELIQVNITSDAHDRLPAGLSFNVCFHASVFWLRHLFTAVCSCTRA